MRRHVKLLVATVDHGLRAESRNEAEWVAREARARSALQHETLTWTRCQARDRHPGRRARGALPAAR